VDSLKCIELVWHAWAAERGHDPEPFLQAAQGRRISDTIRLVRPDLDVAAETRVLDALEEAETRGLHPVPGAAALIARLGDGRWAVVTSCSSVVATRRLRAAEIPIPQVFVTADDVRRAKPDPGGFLLAAHRLGLEPADCLVLEDSPAGVAAGKAAGMRVIAVLTTHTADALADADARVDALAALRLDAGPAGLTVAY
jgi:mannitol-1-/sugar-/sorbitol-6-phosphatase